MQRPQLRPLPTSALIDSGQLHRHRFVGQAGNFCIDVTAGPKYRSTCEDEHDDLLGSVSNVAPEPAGAGVFVGGRNRASRACRRPFRNVRSPMRGKKRSRPQRSRTAHARTPRGAGRRHPTRWPAAVEAPCVGTRHPPALRPGIGWPDLVGPNRRTRIGGGATLSHDRTGD